MEMAALTRYISDHRPHRHLGWDCPSEGETRQLLHLVQVREWSAPAPLFQHIRQTDLQHFQG